MIGFFFFWAAAVETKRSKNKAERPLEFLSVILALTNSCSERIVNFVTFLHFSIALILMSFYPPDLIWLHK